MNKRRILLNPTVLFFFMVILLGVLSVAGHSEEGKIITLYQSGPSLVVERDEVEFEEGVNEITRSVPASVDPRTVFISSPDASLKGSRFYQAVGSEGQLLEKLVGRKVAVTRSGVSGTTIEGKLVGIFNGKPLLETSNGEMRLINNPGEYRFSQLSAKSLDASLELHLVAPEKAETELTVGYQLSGLNWSPQYVGLLDETQESLLIKGIAHINNETNWNFEGVQLRLLAGEPKREKGGAKYLMATRSVNQPEVSAPEEVFEYYRYKVDFPVDISSGVESGLSFFHRDSVDYRKYYLFEPYSSSAVRTMIALNNEKEDGLGIPIASGTIRMYEATDENTFIGSDSLPNLPVGRDTELELGDAFDVKAERNRTSHEKIGERIWKDEVNIKVENSKEKPAEVIVKEQVPGDWEIIRSSHDYEKVDARVIEFSETIPAKGSIEISYLTQYEL